MSGPDRLLRTPTSIRLAAVERSEIEEAVRLSGAESFAEFVRAAALALARRIKAEHDG